MATAALELVPDTGTDIAVAVTKEPGIVLLDRQKFDAWYEKLAAKAPTDADVSTKKGRDTLRSFAAEVRSEKAAIDKARLRLTKEWRDMVSSANDAGKEINERLEQLAIDVRKPLTDWEAAEDARIKRCREIIEAFKSDAVVTLDDTAETVRARGMALFGVELPEDEFRDMLPEAQSAKDAAVATLKTALARLTKEEADRAELERLRQEAEERAEQDRLADEAAAREAREAEEKRVAEERRVEAEKAEAERLARIEREAAENARREAEQAAEAERQRVEREHAEQLAAERRRTEEAERVAQAERDRIAAEEAARAAEAKRIADEQAKREADQAHRTAVKSKAKAAIMSCGADEETARKIVMAIIAGEVPAVKLEF